MFINRFVRCANNVPKPPASIFFFNFMIFFAPILSGFIQVFIANYLGSAEATIQFYLKPISLIYVACSVVLAIFFYIFFMNQICGFEGSEDTIKLSNRAYKNYVAVSIAFPVTMSLVFPGLMAKANGLELSNSISISVYCNTFGGMSLFSLVFYIFFLQILE